jgi:hypothetical protein
MDSLIISHISRVDIVIGYKTNVQADPFIINLFINIFIPNITTNEIVIQL